MKYKRLLGAIKRLFKRPLEYQAKHQGIDERWKIIGRYLPEKPSWILDVGANLGDTARRTAEQGHYVVGIESDRKLAKRAVGEMTERVAIMRGYADPDLFRNMPKFGAVLMLSVLHRIWAVKGKRFAEQCLKNCLQNTNTIIVEGAIRHERYIDRGETAPEFESNNLDDAVRWHTQWLGELVKERGWTTKYLGAVKCSDLEKNRPLFVLLSPTVIEKEDM